LATGQYDKDKLVNIGGNRWWIKPELGASGDGAGIMIYWRAGLTCQL